MIRTVIFLFSLLSILCLNLEAKPGDGFLFGNENTDIVVNNRILAKVNGKAISVIDVMKKMDVFFYRQFPQYTSSPEARFQFYQMNWKDMLEDLIEKELILADAEEVKFPVTNGDVRKEMETLFGPNIITNLDKIGMSYEEAWNIVKGDITIRNMLFFRVNSKALRKVTPQTVREAYDEYAAKNPRKDEWNYYVISVRDPNPARGSQVANFAHDLLNKKTEIKELLTKLNEHHTLEKETVINVSDVFKHSETDLSAAYKEILLTLKSGEHSQPVAQKSRADNSTVYRIFYLEKLVPGGTIPFNEVENILKDQLLEEALEQESHAYIEKMKKHYDLQENLLSNPQDQDFQPFSLK
jgi:hypothetical protein